VNVSCYSTSRPDRPFDYRTAKGSLRLKAAGTVVADFGSANDLGKGDLRGATGGNAMRNGHLNPTPVE